MTKPETTGSPKRHTPAWRRSVLLDARKTSFVAASKKHRIARSALYKFVNRVRDKPEEQWEALLADHKRGPKRGRSKVIRRQAKLTSAVLKISEAQPSWGCNKIQVALRKQLVKASHQTIQSILVAQGRGGRHERWLALDQPGVKFSTVQLAFAEAMNPALQDRTQCGDFPGAVLFVDRVMLPRAIPGQRDVHLYVAIDSCSSHVLCTLARPGAANQWVAFLQCVVLPWLDKRNRRGRRPVLEIRADILGKELGKVKSLLKEKSIELQRRPNRRGSVQRFVTTVGKQFNECKHAREPFATIDEARKAFQLWQKDYNGARFDGFPNFGKSPFKVVETGGRRPLKT